jgi:hypothetical protein
MCTKAIQHDAFFIMKINQILVCPEIKQSKTHIYCQTSHKNFGENIIVISIHILKHFPTSSNFQIKITQALNIMTDTNFKLDQPNGNTAAWCKARRLKITSKQLNNVKQLNVSQWSISDSY